MVKAKQAEVEAVDPEETVEEVGTVSVDRDTAKAVLDALKFKNALEWDDAKILEKLPVLGKIKSIDDHVAKIKDEDVRTNAEAIVEASKAGHAFEIDGGEEVEEEVAEETEEVEVEEEETETEEEEAVEEESEAEGEAEEETEAEEEEPEPEPEPTPAKEKKVVATKTAPAKPAAKVTTKPAAKAAAPAAKTNPKAPAKAPPKEKKEAVEKDAFGMRVGTRAARLNAAITSTRAASSAATRSSAACARFRAARS